MPLSRRQFLRLGPLGFLEAFHQPPRPARLRPPFALGDPEAFLAACRRCGACVAACEHGAIQQLGPVAGDEESTPVMAPAEAPCRWCVDFPCAQACPSGALAYRPGAEPAPIARFTFDPAGCLTKQGILCDDCAQVCPTRVGAMTMRGGRIPEFDAERCVGCGLCARICDGDPAPFTLHQASPGMPVSSAQP